MAAKKSDQNPKNDPVLHDAEQAMKNFDQAYAHFQAILQKANYNESDFKAKIDKIDPKTRQKTQAFFEQNLLSANLNPDPQKQYKEVLKKSGSKSKVPPLKKELLKKDRKV